MSNNFIFLKHFLIFLCTDYHDIVNTDRIDKVRFHLNILIVKHITYGCDRSRSKEEKKESEMRFNVNILIVKHITYGCDRSRSKKEKKEKKESEMRFNLNILEILLIFSYFRV